MVKRFFFLDQENEILAKRFWPGPITLILKRKSLQIPKSLTLNDYCAVRIPKNNFTLEVIKNMGSPLVTAARKAELFGGKPYYEHPLFDWRIKKLWQNDPKAVQYWSKNIKQK